MRKEKRVTVSDVAERAGVSLKTASRVFNNSPHVSQQKRQAVLEAAEKLNFKPNMSARQLASNRSYVLVHFYDNANTDYIAKIYEGMLKACHKHHYYAVAEPISLADGSYADTIINYVSEFNIDGVVLSPPICDDGKLLTRLRANNINYVLISPKDLSPEDYSVFVNEVTASQKMTEHLIEMGHKKIAYVGGPDTHGAARQRKKGFKNAFTTAFGNTQNNCMVSGDFTMQSGHDAYMKIRQNMPDASAIFAANDEMALGVMMAALNHGLKIPEDISIAGYDNSRFAGLFWPSLTTIAPSVDEMATCAAEVLINILAGHTKQQRHYEFPVNLFLRDSCAPLKN